MNQHSDKLIYLIATRLGLFFAMSYTSDFIIAPTSDHWIAAKRILCYVKDIANLSLLYGLTKGARLIGYTH